MHFGEAAVAFEVQLQANQRSRHTVKSYRRDVEMLRRWLEGERHPVDVEHITPTVLLQFPGIGTVLTKTYKGRDLKVVVGDRDFTFDGKSFRSLSAIARQVTGVAWNGYGFFNLLSKAGA